MTTNIRDAASRITSLTDSANSALNQGYEYDTLDRLTRYLGQPANQSYAYDANGNRSSLTIGAASYAYTYATGKNRLTKTAGPAPVRTFTYDAAGNVKGDGTATFTYDARGRMSQVTRSGSTTAYTHNARGERVRKNGPLTPSGTNYFFYDEQGHLIGEYDQNGNALSEFVWLEDIPVAVIKGNEIHHVYTDQLDTPRVILDRQNRVRWRWDAEPFGTTAANENPAGLGTFAFNLRFPGQYFDRETNLHYNTFRDYDPATGRYVQSDPIGLAGGINPYAYVGGNPLSWRDPFGLAVGDFPPPPPGYDPRTWRTGQWDDGRWFVEDPSRKTTYTCHPEDKGHWRHWDKDGDDDGRWPPNSKKPWPGQKRAPYGDQSASDPSGNAPPWQPPTQFSNFPGLPFVPVPSGPLPSIPPVRVPLLPILVP